MQISEFDPIQRRIYDLSQKLGVIGVTGTKGKTTTVSLIAHLLNNAGIPTACTTTIDSRIPGELPRLPCMKQGLLCSFLRRVHEYGIEYAVVEVFSNTLAQGLADFCIFTGAVFTNLGSDHLHVHGNRENYLQAKRRLFTSLRNPGAPNGNRWAVINADDSASPDIVQGMSPSVPTWYYGLPRRRDRDFYISQLRYGTRGSEFILHFPKRVKVPVQTELLGEFNVYNVLAAAAAATCLGLSPEQIQRGLATFPPPPGRFEVVGGGNGRPLVIVDYAHTPESLEQALLAARRLVKRGRLWTVFGCGGSVDASKRPLMGQIAAKQSDCTVLTNDNPRGEDPQAIVADILAGCGEAQVLVELDRRKAITLAIRSTRPQDVIVIAGKGHETEQILGDRTIPFSDREVAQELLTEESPQSTLNPVTHCTDPNRYAGEARLELGDVARFYGYQNFTLSRSGIDVIPQDFNLRNKRDLVRKFFHPDWLRGRSILDLGASSGFFCFYGLLNEASQAVAVDIDDAYIEILKKAKRHFGFEHLDIVKLNVVDYYTPADVVFAFALVHWIYSCTALLGSLDKVVQKISSLTNQVLIVEWIEPSDSMIKFFGHIDWNRNIISGPYNVETFQEALHKYFDEVELLGSISPTRYLYAAYRNRSYKPLPISTLVPQTLEELFTYLNEQNITYVVLSSWEQLPDNIQSNIDEDLDILVHPEHITKLEEIWPALFPFKGDNGVQRKLLIPDPQRQQNFISVNFWSTGDGYFPEDYALHLLNLRIQHKMFYVLPPKEYFLSLLYHVVFHKGIMRYEYERILISLSRQLGICHEHKRFDDFSYVCRILLDYNINGVMAKTKSLFPLLPYLYHPRQVIYSRLLTIHNGQPYHSRIYLNEQEETKYICKQTLFDLAKREHYFLSKLNTDYFPKVYNCTQKDNYSICDMEYVEGYPLSDLKRFSLENNKNKTKFFLHRCFDILEILQEHRITHRDIRIDNILVRNGNPVLLDFGWAISPEMPAITPVELGFEGRPPDGEYCDVYSMGIVFKSICSQYPGFLHVVDAMTKPERRDRITDIPTLRALLDQATPALDIETIKQKKEQIIRRFGSWMAHNIQLHDDIYTIDNRVTEHEIKLRRVIQIISDISTEPLKNLRIIDLACLEGLYAIELVRQGATVLAIEGREANIEKARFSRDVLSLDNLDIVQDDVRNLSKEKYGYFDIVLCLGILYHLDVPDVFHFMEKVAEVCQKFTIIDTHVSIADKEYYVYKDKKYWGRSYIEHNASSSLEERAWKLLASLDNQKSFWFTRSSLYNLLSHVGFTSVYECHNPAETNKAYDRITLVAMKGKREFLHSSPLVNLLPEDDWPEKRNMNVHPSQL